MYVGMSFFLFVWRVAFTDTHRCGESVENIVLQFLSGDLFFEFLNVTFHLIDEKLVGTLRATLLIKDEDDF